MPDSEGASLGSFTEEELAAVREKARTVLLAQALQREENLRQADESLMALEGVDNALAAQLVAAGVKSAADVAALATDELMEKTGLDEETAQKLIMAARASWTDAE